MPGDGLYAWMDATLMMLPPLPMTRAAFWARLNMATMLTMKVFSILSLAMSMKLSKESSYNVIRAMGPSEDNRNALVWRKCHRSCAGADSR